MMGHLSTRDETEEKNNEYEFLFYRAYEKFTYNGGVEFSNPEYKSDRITGGIQQKEIFGLFNQLHGMQPQ